MRCLPPYHNPEEQKYTKTMGEILQFPFNNLQNSSAARPLESSEIGLIRGGVSPRRPPMGFVLQPESFVLEGYWMEKNHSHFLSFWSSNCHQMILNIGPKWMMCGFTQGIGSYLVQIHIVISPSLPYLKSAKSEDSSSLNHQFWIEKEGQTFGINIWVNYNISLTWIKAILGWFPLLTIIPSEVAVRSL